MEHVQFKDIDVPLEPSSTSVNHPALPERQRTPVLLIFALGLLLLLLWWWLGDGASQPESQTEPSEQQALIDRADDYYLQMRRADNEMAIELYQQAIALKPDDSLGAAGLANALVQQVIRFSGQQSPGDRSILAAALAQGLTQTPEAQEKLSRALSLANSAIEAHPEDPRGYKALGFVYAARGEFDESLAQYRRAIELDPSAWQAMINSADVLIIKNRVADAIPYLERAYRAMASRYDEQSAQIQPWHADVGADIGDRYLETNNPLKAEQWYRHVLANAPFNARATAGLASLLSARGDEVEASRLCAEFRERVGEEACAQ